MPIMHVCIKTALFIDSETANILKETTDCGEKTFLQNFPPVWNFFILPKYIIYKNWHLFVLNLF